MDLSLVELNQKLDTLTAQVAYLTEQAQVAERGRQERAELVHDLTPIAEDAFRLTVEQLEEIQEYVDLSDLLRLLKRLLRNGRNLDKLLDQLESVMDLAATVSPLADDAFGKAVDTLAEMEHKGYFAVARGGMQIADKAVASLAAEDFDRLGDNMVLILNTVKSMAQLDTSYLGLLRQAQDPAVRRGLALTMRMLQIVGTQASGNGHTAGNKQGVGA
jgi:uncharacterized protein YjgD (DUF1641 family)